MDTLIKKLQQKYKKVREDMGSWDNLQTQLVSQFRSASCIIERYQLLQETKNYGALGSIPGIKKALVERQIEALGTVFHSMRDTMKQFHGIVLSLQKIARNARQLVEGASTQKQMKLQIGLWPSLAHCLDGLSSIYEMHQSEYLLKESVITKLTYKCSPSDLAAFLKLLVDQPNIPKDEVQAIFDIIFAEEMS